MGGARERKAGAGRHEPSAKGRATGPTPARSDPKPTQVLRRVLETAGWVDRPAAEVQAEEHGLPWRSVRQEIDRLIRLGRIRTRTRPDGRESIAWIPTADAEGA
jgi:hypothetical protein